MTRLFPCRNPLSSLKLFLMKANCGTLAAIWKVDPSGYVYDARTGERLEGFKIAAYWIEYVGDDTLWETTPAEAEYGTLWDASEWDQVNPMLTDEQGKYAWDVPEGWWHVKYEPEGYETVR